MKTHEIRIDVHSGVEADFVHDRDTGLVNLLLKLLH